MPNKKTTTLAVEHANFFEALADAYQAKQTHITTEDKKNIFTACILRDWLNDINYTLDCTTFNEMMETFDSEEKYQDFLRDSILANHTIVTLIRGYFDQNFARIDKYKKDEINDDSFNFYQEMTPLF